MVQGIQVTIQNPRRLSPAQRQVVAEIVRLLLPERPELDGRERVRVESAVTGFVASQIEALPGVRSATARDHREPCLDLRPAVPRLRAA